jgi:hypothetical protein
MPLTLHDAARLKVMFALMYVDLLGRHYALYEAIGQDLPGGPERLESRMQVWIDNPENVRRVAERAAPIVNAIVAQLVKRDQPPEAP